VQDLGLMCNRNLADPDRHVREAMWIDMTAVPSVPYELIVRWWLRAS
jgi:uncharacterized protein